MCDGSLTVERPSSRSSVVSASHVGMQLMEDHEMGPEVEGVHKQKVMSQIKKSKQRRQESKMSMGVQDSKNLLLKINEDLQESFSSGSSDKEG